MKTKVNTFLAAFLMVNVLLVFQGCKKDSDFRSAEKAFGINPSTPVHFVVPNGFRGEIQITQDKTNGIVPIVKTNLIEIDIPTNGCVVLKNSEFLFTEYSESASYADGTPIPDPDMTSSGQEFPRDAVGFYTGGTEMAASHPKETVTWFVGTKEEMEKLK
jgi:hypothetical protein